MLLLFGKFKKRKKKTELIFEIPDVIFILLHVPINKSDKTVKE